jgi:hypothetical protein
VSARERYRRSGRTAERGLFVLGMHWMHTIASGLLFGVGADAAHRAGALSETWPADQYTMSWKPRSAPATSRPSSAAFHQD